MTAVQITQQFDSGNIEVVSLADPLSLRLRIRHDSNADFFQWFHFRVQAPAGQRLRLVIENAGESSYADGWNGYQCAASVDRQDWSRIADTFYDGRELSIELTMPADVLWLAYFEPFSQERHADLLGRAASDERAQLMQLGASVQGRSIDLLRIGNPDAARKVWIIARQHPGESMAEWCAEGLLDALLDTANPHAREILQRACVHLVPNVNPDGSFLGNLRSNAAGANLNREWMTPTPERSPEVLCVRQGMLDSGVDLFLDLHGDETLPYVFIDGSHMVPSYGERNQKLQANFLDELKLASPDFQTANGYADNRFDEELLTLASKWVANQFNCVALTLEMPFKDNADAPDARTGWNGARSKIMGAALLQPILGHLRRLEQK
ncbi:MAG: M14-type cytosolic carboxypeptidase [Rhodocyclaceae bacterium]